MDLTERIERRRTRSRQNELIVDFEPLNPVVHPSEPVGREALIEALLNAVDPLFDRSVPPNTYVWGSKGAGKSAIVTGLLSALKSEVRGTDPFYAATRGGSDRSDVRFVYLDARRDRSRFQLYRSLLDDLLAESVPKRGVSTETLQERIGSVVGATEVVLVAVDHIEEPTTVDLSELHTFFEPFEKLAWIGVGRTPPAALSFPMPEQQIHIPEYTHELVDILTVRGSRGLSHTLDHRHAQRIAEWADGDAHDALAALYIAAKTAERDGVTRLRDADIDAGIGAVPSGGVAIGQVLALSENEQRVIEQLLALSLEDEVRIEDAAAEIAGRTDLTAATVKRLLYELAQFGVLERQEVPVGARITGQKPSGVALNFSAGLFTAIGDG